MRLVRAFSNPYAGALAAARTCYAADLVMPEALLDDPKAWARARGIGAGVFAAGHHTVFQHAHFHFALERVSRQFVWSFLHAHPFYNSEQQSQRYVRVAPDSAVIPSMPVRARTRFASALNRSWADYEAWVALLQPAVEARYRRLFPTRRCARPRWKKAIERRALEIARYLLPVATHTCLHHTISGLTLFRYARALAVTDAPEETRAVVQAMLDAVRVMDGDFLSHIEDPLPIEDTAEFQALQRLGSGGLSSGARGFCRAFDRELAGGASRLVDGSAGAERTIAHAVRDVLGLAELSENPAPARGTSGSLAGKLSDADALALVLDPAQNPQLADTLNLGTMSKLSRALHHAHFTFQKKLSHSADSQDQRHRMTPGSRPLLSRHFDPDQADFVTPALIASDAALSERYQAAMEARWADMRAVLDEKASIEAAMYLLPNAFPIRFLESGDLAAWRHKWVTRLCLNAQEEIWRASRDEVAQLRHMLPGIGRYLAPPCWQRFQAGRRPICPEGERYCGVPAWRVDLLEYERLL